MPALLFCERKTWSRPIGAHFYGGATNSASVTGQYGNPYDAYVSAFDKAFPPVKVPAGVASVPNVTYYNVPTMTTESSSGTERSLPTAEEGFFDFLKSAARIAAPLAGNLRSTQIWLPPCS